MTQALAYYSYWCSLTRLCLPNFAALWETHCFGECSDLHCYVTDLAASDRTHFHGLSKLNVCRWPRTVWITTDHEMGCVWPGIVVLANVLDWEWQKCCNRKGRKWLCCPAANLSMTSWNFDNRSQEDSSNSATAIPVCRTFSIYFSLNSIYLFKSN